MLEFAAGIGTALAVVAALLWHFSKLSRERNRLFYEMQVAIFDVQDAVALHHYWPTTDRDTLADRLSELRRLKAERNRAADAYYAALKGK